MSGRFESRYDVFGPPNGCTGDCEGTTWVPIDGVDVGLLYARPDAIVRDPRADPPRPIYRVLWALAEAKSPNPPEDRWHFVPCPDCRPRDPLVVLAKRLMGGPDAPQGSDDRPQPEG